MKLWDFALAVYDRPAVREACLRLQDDHGQCVSLLLWASWMASEGRAGPLDEAVSLARGWEDAVISPLRAARRGLKSAPPLGDSAYHLTLVEAVSAAEIEAERLLLEALEQRAPPATGAARDPAPALLALVETWDPTTPRNALNPLLRSLA